jgi:spore coat protein A
VDALPIPSIAKPQGTRPSPLDHSVSIPYYRLAMSAFELKVHRDVPATRLWGFDRNFPGPTIQAAAGKPLLVEWQNQLPAKHFLPIDHNLMGAEVNQPEVRTVIHLHGGRVPPMSDGYPENWYGPGKSATTFYPNSQEATLLWYHDHAMGITRLNMVAGLFGLFILRDKFEQALNLPSGEFEIPLVLCDRMFKEDGQLYYPVSQVPTAPWLPEFFGDCILVNGKLLPYLDVQPRKYRFRLLNAANGRFFSLALSNEQTFHQIGSDQGLLAEPVELSELLCVPGERADLIIDFARGGQNIVLRDGVSPVMQFRVGKSSGKDSSGLPKQLRPVARTPESAATRTRELTLEEFDNVLDEPVTHLLNGKRWHDPVTEDPLLDTVEIWSLFNLTDDAHPIHLHLVRFQILDRQPLDVPEYVFNKRTRYTGDRFPPEANESGWKDTVRAAPRAVTRIIVKFEGYAGRYVWHCHIAEHEDNEMMRPYEIRPPLAKLPAG